MYERLTEFMQSPLVRGLRERHYELTGEDFSGWNWYDFSSMEDYLNQIQEAIAQAEREAEQRQE